MALRFFMAVRAMIEDQVVRILPGQLQMGFFRGALSRLTLMQAILGLP
jgi:hypothetical protein